MNRFGRPRGGLTLDEMFARQARRVARGLRVRETIYRRRLAAALEESDIVECYGYTQGGQSDHVLPGRPDSQE